MSRDRPPPSGHDDLMELILASLTPNHLRQQLAQRLSARGNTAKRWKDHVASSDTRHSQGRLWSMNRVFEPVTLGLFMNFMGNMGGLPGGGQTELPLLGEDFLYVMKPLSEWAPAPYNRPGKSVMQETAAKLGSYEDTANLQRLSRSLVDMKARVWNGHAPMSDRRWAQRRLDEPENFTAACEIIANVLAVFFYLNTDQARNKSRKTYNRIWDVLKEFETALNAKRRLEDLPPVSPTALWAVYVRAHYARMESRAHAWIMKRLNVLKEVVLQTLASHTAVGPFRQGYDETQWTLMDRWQDIVQNVSDADLAIFIPMDGYKGLTSASATDRPLAGSGMYSGTTPLRFSSSIDQRAKDYHMRRRQINLMTMMEPARPGHAPPREPLNSPATLVRTCCQQEEAQDQAREEWRLTNPSDSHLALRDVGEMDSWGFVVYRGCYSHADAQWAEFKAKFETDIRDWGREVDKISSLRARSKVHWCDPRDLGLSETDTESLKQHFRSYRDTAEFPQRVMKTVFLVADEAAVGSYLNPLPDPPLGLVGDFGGFILAVDSDHDPLVPIDRADESPGYKGALRVLGSALWDDFCATITMRALNMSDMWSLAMYHPFEVYVGPIGQTQSLTWRALRQMRADFVSSFLQWRQRQARGS